MISTVAPCRWALRSIARADAVIRSATSPSVFCTLSVRRRNASVSPRAVRRPSNIRLIAASCSCDAPAASSAPEAICSIDLRNCSAAAEACVSPLANSSVAAATRSNRASGVPVRTFWPRSMRVGERQWLRRARDRAALGAPAAIFELLTRAILDPALSARLEGDRRPRPPDERGLPSNSDNRSLSDRHQGSGAPSWLR